jgi:DNA helicase HerA-like ATPase
MSNPRLYSTFLLWLLSELFENLPEVGDREKPKLVFFFDEAHLLFTEAPDALVEKVEQVVRLIRSKGVGVYFVTQNPIDIPDRVLGQLGNRVQHALRAFTPRDQKAVNSVAETMRPNPGLDIKAAILELAVGEALISLLDEKGTPGITQRAWVIPPASQIGPITPADRQAFIANSLVAGQYERAIDRESAFEMLRKRAEAAPQAPPQASFPASRSPMQPPNTSTAATGGLGGVLGGLVFGSTGPRGGKRDGMIDLVAKSAARSMGSSIARQITRGVLGSIFGGRRR